MDRHRRAKLAVIAIFVLGPTIILAVTGLVTLYHISVEQNRPEYQSTTE